MKSVSFVVVVLAAAFGIAQSAHPDFSGDWKMNIVKTDFGPLPAPSMLNRTIKHADPVLEYTQHLKGQQGETDSKIRYTTDGKPCVNTLNGGEAKGAARWQGDNLLIEYTRDFQGTQISSKETWALSEDGKTLTINSHVSVPQQGEYNLKLVLEKQ
jgi:hypothetical protein